MAKWTNTAGKVVPIVGSVIDLITFAARAIKERRARKRAGEKVALDERKAREAQERLERIAKQYRDTKW